MTLSWAAPSSTGGNAITGYTIQRSNDAEATWVTITTVSSTTTSYDDTGLDQGTTRHYRIAAVNDVGIGEYTDAAHATTELLSPPEAVTSLAAEAETYNEISVSWTAPTDTGGAAITGYRLRYSTDAGTTYQILVANTMSTETFYAHTGLEADSTYYYKVAAINSVGVGIEATAVSATTPEQALVPDAPLTLGASPGDGTITLTWPDAVDNGNELTKYQYRVEERTWRDVHVGDVVTADVNTFTLFGLTNGEQKTVSLRAVNGNGAGPAIMIRATPTTVPGAPTLVSIEVSDEALILNWTAPTTDHEILSYEYRQDSGDWISTASIATSFLITGLTNGTEYAFQVRAVNDIGVGAASNTVEATPLASSAVPQITATAGQGSVTLLWQKAPLATRPLFEWDELTDLHTGLIQHSPHETNLLVAGNYTVGIKAVDTSGIESRLARLVQTTIGDPRFGASFLQIYPRAEGWPGDTTNATKVLDAPRIPSLPVYQHPQSSRMLVGVSDYTWEDLEDDGVTWEDWSQWTVNPVSSLSYTHPTIDIGFVTQCAVKVIATGTGSQTVTISTSLDGETYTDAAPLVTQYTARYFNITVTMTVPDGDLPVLRHLSMIFLSEPISELLEDRDMSTLPGSPGDRRLVLGREFVRLTSVQIALQNVGFGYTWELVDKSTIVGPRIKVYNQNGDLTDVTVDAVIRGV